MQKIIKLETENTPLERWTENSACEIYSHDTNNGQFEIEVMNEALTDETVTALFIFEESQSVWRTTGTIEENKIKFKFDTTLITQDETVVCVLYLDNERENNDFYRFNFKVKVSEIDKLDNLTVKERFFKNNLIVDRLDVVTKTELQEILKTIDLSNISTDGLLTEEKANGLYAKISELEAVESKIITQEQLTTTKNEVVTEINNRLENYALKTNIPEPYNDTSLVSRVSDLERKTDKDTIYDDSDLKARISVLESREDNNTIYDDTSVRERLTMLENKPNVDISNLATKEELAAVRGSQPNVDNLVTKDELEAKHYISDVSSLATKEELNEVRNSQPTVDTSHLVTREELEEKHYLTTHQDLSEYALKSELPQPYNDSALVQKIGQLEARVDNDTIYNDTEVKHRLTELENKPVVDTSVFVTDEKLSNYALKSELPTPYNDKPLNERVMALESKAIEGGTYDDSDLRNRVTNLESIDTSKFVTDEKLESKGYLKSHQDITGLATKEELANLVTNDQLEAKHYITGAALENYALKSDIPQGYNDAEVKERLTVLENKQDKDTVYNDSELRNRVSELEQRPIATPYNDTALSDRVSALETKQDKDTVYNDEPIKERLTALENKPNIDLTGYATKQELKNKVDNSDYDTFKGMVVTKGYLESKNYLTEQYNDKPLTDRVVALESKTPVDLSNYATKQELHEATEIDYSQIVTHEELEEKHYLTANNLANYALKSEIPAKYNDSALVSRVTALESKPTTNQFEIHGTGMPNGVVTADIGTTYVDKNKTNGALKWIKTTNGGNTGWRVFTGDTGWRTLPLINKRGNARLQVRRINDEIIVKFDGLSWGWFGVDDLERQGGNIVEKTIAGKKYTWIKLNIGQGNNVLPAGFRSASSLLSGLYGDLGDLLGSVYVGGTADSNAIQLRYAMARNELTSNILSQIRISPVAFITDDEWPVKLP